MLDTLLAFNNEFAWFADSIDADRANMAGS